MKSLFISTNFSAAVKYEIQYAFAPSLNPNFPNSK